MLNTDPKSAALKNAMAKRRYNAVQRTLKKICCQDFSYLVLTPPPPVPSESTCGMPALTQVLPITKLLCQPHIDIPFSRTVNGKSIIISSAPSIK